MAKHSDRIGYVLLKSVVPDAVAKIRTEGMSLAQAVQLGAMFKPEHGEHYRSRSAIACRTRPASSLAPTAV